MKDKIIKAIQFFTFGLVVLVFGVYQGIHYNYSVMKVFVDLTYFWVPCLFVMLMTDFFSHKEIKWR